MKNFKLISILAFLCVFVATADSAITAPVAGSFAYDLYDVGVLQILDGPIGFTAGVAAMVLGAVSAMQQKLMQSVAPILGGVFMMNADSIVTSMGAMIF